MKNENLARFQELLKKKQEFTNKAIACLQKGEDKKAEMFFNFDSGLNIEIIKLLEIQEDVTQPYPVSPEEALYDGVIDETMYEDIRREDEDDR